MLPNVPPAPMFSPSPQIPDLSHRCGRSPRPAATGDGGAEHRGSAQGPPLASPWPAGRGSHGRPAALLLHTGLTAAPGGGGLGGTAAPLPL